ncbi:MAG: hydrogenase, partial [Desulfobacterales bacterium]|nr:hydrogenase [Desulfobacterales bacterium]
MLSLHDIDLLDSLGMAEMRGHRPYLRVVGIEPDKIDWGTELTESLARALPDFMNVARKHIRELLDRK